MQVVPAWSSFVVVQKSIAKAIFRAARRHCPLHLKCDEANRHSDIYHHKQGGGSAFRYKSQRIKRALIKTDSCTPMEQRTRGHYVEAG
jgi:hypothetical protein